jgi:hypothetical protein
MSTLIISTLVAKHYVLPVAKYHVYPYIIYPCCWALWLYTLLLSTMSTLIISTSVAKHYVHPVAKYHVHPCCQEQPPLLYYLVCLIACYISCPFLLLHLQPHSKTKQKWRAECYRAQYTNKSKYCCQLKYSLLSIDVTSRTQIAVLNAQSEQMIN